MALVVRGVLRDGDLDAIVELGEVRGRDPVRFVDTRDNPNAVADLARGELIAVLDVDSTIVAAFDYTDQRWLEQIVGLLAEKESLPLVASA